jgi:RuvA, C-terminal domain/HNH endonuclease
MMMTVGESDRAEWEQAHQALVQLARSRAGLDFEEGQRLVAALRSRVHQRLGYGSFVEYIERLFGYAPRLTHEKLRVAEELEELPALAQSLRDGLTSWSCLRELTRTATPETERVWLDAARGRTAREVEKLVSGHRPGSLPSDPVDAGALRHVLRFDVSGDVLATFREAMAKIRRDAGGPLDDDAALLLMARHVLGGPIDEGRANYQVALTLCEGCQRGQQEGLGELVEVPAEVVAMARCDGQHLGQTHVGPKVTSSSESELVRGRGRRDPDDGSTSRDGASVGKRTLRAKQDVAPAVRRSVLRRDQHRCAVPGCRHATFVDVHHIETREDGGAHEADNLITLCSAHHRASHRGELVVCGRVSSGVSFHHADGTKYGGAVSAQDAAVQARAFQALRGLGFGEREARRALWEVLTHVGGMSSEANLEAVLRRALQRLTARGLSLAS